MVFVRYVCQLLKIVLCVHSHGVFEIMIFILSPSNDNIIILFLIIKLI